MPLTVDEYKQEILEEVEAAGPDGLSYMQIDIALVRRNYPDIANMRPALDGLVASGQVVRLPPYDIFYALPKTKEENDNTSKPLS